MEDGAAATGRSSGRNAAIGSAIAVWAFADPIIGLIVVAAAALWLHPLVVFAIAAVVLSLVNIVACTWLDDQWTAWEAGHGARVDRRLAKMRSGRVMRHPVDWITHGSALWFALASILINAVLTIAIARTVGGKPVGARRIRLASLSYSIFIAGFYALVGWAIGDTMRAI